MLLRLLLAFGVSTVLVACDGGEEELLAAAQDLCDSVREAGDPQRALDEGLGEAERAGQFRSGVLDKMEERCPAVLEDLDQGQAEMAEEAEQFEIGNLECRRHRAGGTVHNGSSTGRDVRIVVVFLADDDTEVSRVRAEISDVQPGADGHWEVKSGVRAGAEDCAVSVEGVR